MLFKRREKYVETNQPLNLHDAVEFTLLDPRAIDQDIKTLVNIAIKNSYYAVCVNPTNVFVAKDIISKSSKPEIKIVSVVGFPLGANKIATKVEEARSAISDGADELDVVINISKAKEGDYSYIKDELSRIVRISKGRIIKAVIETCYLSRDEIKNVCKACVKAKIDYVMTSTGYGSGGANVEDVSYLHEILEGKCAVKASGAIKSPVQAEELIRAGANRIGTSRVIWWNIFQKAFKRQTKLRVNLLKQYQKVILCFWLVILELEKQLSLRELLKLLVAMMNK